MSEPLLPDGSPVASRQHKSKLITVCPFILGNEFCERLAFYGLATNMVIYLTQQMGMDAGSAGMQVSLFQGTCYLTPLIGAWLADSHWGRYKTIIVFSIIYAIGMFGMAASAIVPGFKPVNGSANLLQLSVFYIALYVVAVGTGGIKPNVSAFGADQFDDSIRAERIEKQSFFNWFYFTINVGSLIACTVVVWIQGWSWSIGFGIPAIAMVLAVFFFMAGSPLYNHITPSGSPLERLISVVFCAAKHRIGRAFKKQPEPRDNGGESSPLAHQHSYQWITEAVTQPSDNITEDDYDRAGRDMSFNAQQVEEVRMVVRMFPIFFLTILYWTIYTQMAAVFVLQGEHLNRNVPWVNGKTFEVPAASLTMFDTLSIIVLIPVYDGIINPLMKRYGCAFTLLQRIGWGMLLSVLAMVTAAYVERKRMAALADGREIGVFQQAGQYFLVGASEVLASIGQLEFFYDQAPDVMRSCCGALALLSTALGGYVSALLLWAVKNYTMWLTDLNHGSRLDLYFMVLAGIMLANTLIFALVATQYTYKKVKHRRALPRVGIPTTAGRHRLDPPAPQGAPASQAINISNRLQLPGYGYQYEETPLSATPDVGIYGRSVTYFPTTPAFPPNFR